MCSSKQFFGGEKIFCTSFPKFTRKTFTRQTFSLIILCSCWYITFFSIKFHRLQIEYLVLGIWFQKPNLKKIGCASEASWLSILEHLPHSSEVFSSHSRCCCQQRTSNKVDVGLNLLPSLKTYMWYASYYLHYDYDVSLTSLSVQLHI